MTTLYRKHRPQLFSEMIGQNHVKLTLQYEIASGKIAHAYIFCGPRGVGKTTLARLFAKSLNCLKRKDGEYEPCDKCDNCADIREGRSFDIIEIDAASHTGVDNVRENIIASSRISPGKSKYKVFIIDEVHMLSLSAFNALLKVLEEPSPNVVFILCTTEVHKVPTTIISRCQRFDFKRIGVKDMVKKLEYIVKAEGIKIEKGILEEIARHSEGHLRDAESLLGQVRAVGGKEITKEEASLVIPRSDINEVVLILEYLAKKDAAGALRSINKSIDEGFDLKVFINSLVEVARKLLIMKINPALAEALSMEYGESIELKLRKLIDEMPAPRIIDIINEFSEARIKMKDSSIIQLPAELAIVKLCIRQDNTTPEADKGKAVPSSPGNYSTGEIHKSENATKNHSNQNISGEHKSKWPEAIEKIKKHNHSLSFILEVCVPMDMTSDNLVLAFKYKFHKDRLNDPKLKSIVENVISEVYGRKIAIETILDESIQIEKSNSSENKVSSNAQSASKEKPEKDDDGEIIDSLLKTFGGKVM